MSLYLCYVPCIFSRGRLEMNFVDSTAGHQSGRTVTAAAAVDVADIQTDTQSQTLHRRLSSARTGVSASRLAALSDVSTAGVDSDDRPRARSAIARRQTLTDVRSTPRKDRQQSLSHHQYQPQEQALQQQQQQQYDSEESDSDDRSDGHGGRDGSQLDELVSIDVNDTDTTTTATAQHTFVVGPGVASDLKDTAAAAAAAAGDDSNSNDGSAAAAAVDGWEAQVLTVFHNELSRYICAVVFFVFYCGFGVDFRLFLTSVFCLLLFAV